MQTKIQRVAAAALLAFSLASSAFAAYEPKAPDLAATEKIKELDGVGIEEKLGTHLDLNLTFKDENGETVTLAKYMGSTPVIFSPVYYSCPGLCNFHLNGLTDALKLVDWNVGDKFKVVAVSFDSKEGPDVAAKKKASYMKVYDRAGTEGGWHFLTGDEAAVQAFTSAVGFKFKWSAEANEWAHASAAIVVTPDGKISRYLPGIMFDPKDVKLALNEASSGKIGTFVDQLVLYCFQYNPHQSKYTLYAFNLMKLGGALMVLVLALWLLPVWVRSRRAEAKAARS
ncbi:SCO family protein [Bdellovibrio sp. HCB337]|uniref:SCO family protein n=1 Tax=Bdellovibrio sp. HCB337 TaxID=3394358 RepID=UPI0039A4CE5C